MSHRTDDQVSREVIRWLLPLTADEIAAGTTGWGEAEWLGARQAALVHGIAPLLHARWLQLQPRPSSHPRFAAYLAQQYHRNAEKNLMLEKALHDALRLAASAQVPVLPLKGAALLRTVYRDPALRPMADLDLLVAAPDAVRFAALLEQHGYAILERVPGQIVFRPPSSAVEVINFEGEHPGNPFTLELHTAVTVDVWGTRQDITGELWGSAVDGGIGGQPARRLTDVHQMLLLVCHTAKHMIKGALRALQLWDLALAGESLTDGQWRELVAAAGRIGAERLCYPPLVLAQRVAGLSLPSAALAALAGKAPPRLKRLAAAAPVHDFSLVNEEFMLRRQVELAPSMALRALAAVHRLAVKNDMFFRHRLSWVWPGPERRRALRRLAVPPLEDLRRWYPRWLRRHGSAAARVVHLLFLLSWPLFLAAGRRRSRLLLAELLKQELIRRRSIDWR